MKEKFKEVEKEAIQELESINDEPGLEIFRVKYLGKKGVLTSLMKLMNDLS